MRVESIAIERMNPTVYNPKIDLQPGDPEYEKLKRSITQFGYIDPIIWNERTGSIVGGHQRYKILVDQGETELCVSVVDLDEIQEKALNLALNKISGDWDEYKLVELLRELQLEGIDLSITGFDEGELDTLIVALSEPDTDQIGDFVNKELNLSDFDESQFNCACPRCGFVFDSKRE